MTNEEKIVRYLRKEQPDGTFVQVIAQELDIHPSLVQKIVRASKRIYVDRWVKPTGSGRPKAVHCAASPEEATPEDCPPPAKQVRVRVSVRKSRSVWQAWG